MSRFYIQGFMIHVEKKKELNYYSACKSSQKEEREPFETEWETEGGGWMIMSKSSCTEKMSPQLLMVKLGKVRKAGADLQEEVPHR